MRRATVVLTMLAMVATGAMAGVTVSWNKSLAVYPGAYAGFFSITYPTPVTPGTTDVDITCNTAGVTVCVAAQSVAAMGEDQDYATSATIAFDNTADHLAEIGLSARVSGNLDSGSGYMLGLNPYDPYFTLVEVNTNIPDIDGQDAVAIVGFSATLTYKMKLVVDGNQIDGYLYSMADVELGHVSLTDTTPQNGTEAGTYIWNSAADPNTVAPQGSWIDCRITPEPTTMGLLGLGALGLLLRRRKVM